MHKELPIIVRFLLDSIHDKESGKMIMEQLRSKLSEYISSHDDSHSCHFLSCISSLLNAIKLSFMSNDMLFSLYYELMLSLKNKFVVIDLWICFSLYCSNRFRSKIQTMLLRGYSLNKLSLYDSIVSYANILESDYQNIIFTVSSDVIIYFHRLLIIRSSQHFLKKVIGSKIPTHLSQNILLSGISFEVNHLLSSLELYLIIYCEFANASYRQDLIASVIRHISSHQQQPSESYMALYLLQCIAELEYAIMLSHGLSSSSPPQLYDAELSQLIRHLSYY